MTDNMSDKDDAGNPPVFSGNAAFTVTWQTGDGGDSPEPYNDKLDRWLDDLGCSRARMEIGIHALFEGVGDQSIDLYWGETEEGKAKQVCAILADGNLVPIIDGCLNFEMPAPN